MFGKQKDFLEYSFVNFTYNVWRFLLLILKQKPWGKGVGCVTCMRIPDDNRESYIK